MRLTHYHTAKNTKVRLQAHHLKLSNRSSDSPIVFIPMQYNRYSFWSYSSEWMFIRWL